MRHCKSGRKLNRDSNHRRAMFRNMSISLFEHELIKTTLAKAKELRRFVEPLITLAKTDTVANRRLVAARLGNSRPAVKRLFEDIAPLFSDRPGGYLRVLKCGYRLGDAAPMAYVELVARTTDEPETEAAPEPKKSQKKSEKMTEKKVAEKSTDSTKASPKKDDATAEKAEPKKTAPKADKAEKSDKK